MRSVFGIHPLQSREGEELDIESLLVAQLELVVYEEHVREVGELKLGGEIGLLSCVHDPG